MNENPSSGNVSNEPKARTSPWKTVSLACFLGVFLCFLIGLILSILLEGTSDLFETTFIISTAVLLLTSFVTSTIALIHIESRKGILKGIGGAYLTFFASGFFLYLAVVMPTMGKVPHIAQRVVCGTNLKGLGNALVVYANEYETFPTDQWCNLLIEHADVSPKSFVCPASKDEEGECSYALNKYIAGKKNEFSAGIVLAFETKLGTEKGERTHTLSERETFGKYSIMQEIFSGQEKIQLHRWNQVGGPEDLNASAHKNHQDGCNILFADGHTAYCKVKELPDLKWDPANDSIRWNESMMPEEEIETGMPAAIKNRNLLILGAVLAALSILGWLLLPGWKMKVFGFCAVLVAAGMGAFWGLMTENLYLETKPTKIIGWQTGIAWGVLTAVWYCWWLCRMYKAGRLVPCGPDKRRVQYDLLAGMAAGVFCSMAVHLTLGLYHDPSSWAAIIHGPYFGLLAGLLTAAIIRAIFSTRFMDQPALPPIPEQTQEEIQWACSNNTKPSL